ncbi:MAG: DUF488 family protein [Streptosporangiales bacterium]|nr:DUF488 family protein [Streptosporangiales bacterium]
MNDVTLCTFGHGTASEERIVELLRAAGVELLVDVRAAPGSRFNPHVARSALERWLPDNRIAYRHEDRLGGRRSVPYDSPDTALDDAFAGYAAHMRTAEFRAAVDDLMADTQRKVTAVMCAESAWTRCHRSMIADFLVAVRDVPVVHLGHDGGSETHRVSEMARRRDDGMLVYDQGQLDLFT